MTRNLPANTQEGRVNVLVKLYLKIGMSKSQVIGSER